jgi:hypothetical protein
LDLQYKDCTRGWYTANEEPVRIQYKCLVLISVLPEMKLLGLVIYRTELNILSPNFHIQVSESNLYIPRIDLTIEQNYNILSPNFHIHVSLSNLYIPRIDLTILLQPNRQTDPVNI